jgi:phage terminase large subunit-like protein
MVGYHRALEDELTAFSTSGYLGEKSPNHADAMVWAMSDLFPGMVKPEKPKVKTFGERFNVFGNCGWMA